MTDAMWGCREKNRCLATAVKSGVARLKEGGESALRATGSRSRAITFNQFAVGLSNQNRRQGADPAAVSGAQGAAHHEGSRAMNQLRMPF